jgi:hypothetical protein
VNATITNSAFTNAKQANNGQGGAAFSPFNNGTLEFTFENNKMANIGYGQAISGTIGASVFDAGRANISIQNNTITNVPDRFGILISSEQTTTNTSRIIDVKINNNTMDGIGGTCVWLRANKSTPDMDVEIRNNNLGLSTPVGFLGFGAGNFTAIEASTSDAAQLDINIDNNTVVANANPPDGALNFLGTVSVWSDTPVTGARTVNARVTNNTISNLVNSTLRLHMDQFDNLITLNGEVNGNQLNGGRMQLWEENANRFFLRSVADVSARNNGAVTSFPGSAGPPTNTASLPSLPTFNFPNP